MEIFIKNLEELEGFAKSFLLKLKPHESKAIVVALSGDLGSGKTAFVKAVAKTLGVTETVSSPTFVIMKYYQLKTIDYRLLIHIDAYRLKNGAELLRLRFDELLDDPQNIIFIEWPEHVADALPKDVNKIFFQFIDETTRKISFST